MVLLPSPLPFFHRGFEENRCSIINPPIKQFSQLHTNLTLADSIRGLHAWLGETRMVAGVWGTEALPSCNKAKQSKTKVACGCEISTPARKKATTTEASSSMMTEVRPSCLANKRPPLSPITRPRGWPQCWQQSHEPTQHYNLESSPQLKHNFHFSWMPHQYSIYSSSGSVPSNSPTDQPEEKVLYVAWPHATPMPSSEPSSKLY